jgi:hypothetical protein
MVENAIRLFQIRTDQNPLLFHLGSSTVIFFLFVHRMFLGQMHEKSDIEMPSMVST